MLRRIFFVVVASALMMSALGCACSNKTATPTPTATIKPAATPSVAPVATPETGMESPNASTSPNAGATGTGTIENFKEGTEVKPEDVPEIKKAIEEKYAGATIKTIKHAMKDGKQVYETEIDMSGKTKTIYISPDGMTIEEKTAS